MPKLRAWPIVMHRLTWQRRNHLSLIAMIRLGEDREQGTIRLTAGVAPGIHGQHEASSCCRRSGKVSWEVSGVRQK